MPYAALESNLSVIPAVHCVVLVAYEMTVLIALSRTVGCHLAGRRLLQTGAACLPAKKPQVPPSTFHSLGMWPSSNLGFSAKVDMFSRMSSMRPCSRGSPARRSRCTSTVPATHPARSHGMSYCRLSELSNAHCPAMDSLMLLQ